ncbi:hypothetical protein Taro_010167 [Colocasia esculenta]|uniref:Uncharacterized protein n=1 Tax=Colocasia esculenta TaxID=4460 RepID=A0A843U296_COLES|nr:hypothetical protein [Colocasia esculenta]
MPRTVWSSTRRRPASPSSHCLAPYGPGTVWRGQAWDRSSARLRRLLLCYLCSYLALTRCEGETSQQRQGARRVEETGQ